MNIEEFARKFREKSGSWLEEASVLIPVFNILDQLRDGHPNYLHMGVGILVGLILFVAAIFI